MRPPLPLFPLNLVLFPGELLPLHIFEPRYRRMLADCLQGDPRFGITPDTTPGSGSVGCIARIRGTEPLADGRANIVVLGEERFGVREILVRDTPYLVAAIEEFSDQNGTDPTPVELAELRRLGTELRESLGALTDQPGEHSSWADDAEALSFQVASLVETDLEARLRMLVSRSTRERAKQLLELLPALLSQVQRRAEVHVRARSNGAGHYGSDIVHG